MSRFPSRRKAAACSSSARRWTPPELPAVDLRRGPLGEQVIRIDERVGAAQRPRKPPRAGHLGARRDREPRAGRRRRPVDHASANSASRPATHAPGDHSVGGGSMPATQGSARPADRSPRASVTIAPRGSNPRGPQLGVGAVDLSQRFVDVPGRDRVVRFMLNFQLERQQLAVAGKRASATHTSVVALARTSGELPDTRAARRHSRAPAGSGCGCRTRDPRQRGVGTPEARWRRCPWQSRRGVEGAEDLFACAVGDS